MYVAEDDILINPFLNIIINLPPFTRRMKVANAGPKFHLN